MSDQEADEWVTKAEADYRIAVEYNLDPQKDADQICIHCQQCIEKYLKAVIVSRGQQYQKTHNLNRLAELAAAGEPSVSGLVDRLAVLKSNMNFRYPGSYASREDAEAAQRATAYLRAELRALLALQQGT